MGISDDAVECGEGNEMFSSLKYLFCRAAERGM